MTLHVASDGLHVYDDDADVWRKFDAAEQLEEFLASYSTAGTGQAVELTERVSGDYQTFTVTLTPGNPPLPITEYDPRRKSVQITATSSANGQAWVGKAEVLGAGNAGGNIGYNGYPIQNNGSVTIETVEPVYAVAATGVVTLSVLVTLN